jgi:hypothetical protein
MRNETATAPARAIPLQGSTFTLIETKTAIAETIQQLHATGTSQTALVSIRLVYKTLEKIGQTGSLSAERARQGSLYLLESIRPLVRKTDHVFLHQHTCYFVLPEANLQGAEIVEERLWEALLWRTHNMDEQETMRPTQLAIGYGAFPDPHSSPAELLHAASEVSKHFNEHANRAIRHRRPRDDEREKELAQQVEKEELPLLARKLGIPYLTLLPRELPQRVLQTVNARLARELRCYPLGRERNMLTVAMLNPQDHNTLERLHRETGLSIFPVLTHPEALDRALRQLS